MSMPTPPSRRWFRFSLRTIFVVVTVFAVWLGWELKFIRDRKVFLKWVDETSGSYGTKSEWAIRPNNPFSNTPDVAKWRRWLGDDATIAITLGPGYTKDEAARMWRLFPEAINLEPRPGDLSAAVAPGHENRNPPPTKTPPP
jgi:hypothetical protein